MACFLVSGGEAIVVTAVRAAVKKSEMKRALSMKTAISLPTRPSTASAGRASFPGS